MFNVNKKTPERRHWRRSDVFIVHFEHTSDLFLVFLLLFLNKSMLTGKSVFGHATLLKQDSGTVAFLWIMQKISKHRFFKYVS